MNNSLIAWLVYHVGTAQSKEHLAMLADMLKRDRDAGREYTKDTAAMNTIRAAYKKRLNAIDREFEEREG